MSIVRNDFESGLILGINVVSESKSSADLERHRKFLHSIAVKKSRMLNGRVSAADLVQETLLRGYEKISTFKGRTHAEMAAWLSSILGHLTADHWRAFTSQKRDVSRERSIQSNANSSTVNTLRGGNDWLPSHHTSPSLRASRNERAASLTDAIRQLPEAQQTVINLHHLQGHSLADVAAKTGRSSSSVAGLLYRGLKSLRELMDAPD